MSQIPRILVCLLRQLICIMLNMMPFTQHTSTQTDTDITSQVDRIHVYMNLYLQRASIHRNPFQAYIRSRRAAAPSDSVFRALGTN